NACDRQGDDVKEDEGKEDRPARVPGSGQPAKDQAVGDAYELHQQDGRNQLDGAEAQLRAVNGGDADDRADTVVIDEEGDQELEQLAIAAQVAEGRAQPLVGGAQHALARRQAHRRGRRLWHYTQHGDGEDGPPDGDAEEGETRAQVVFGQQEDHDDVDRQEQPAAQVADGVAARGNHILVFRPGDVRQHRVVKDNRGAEADPGEDESGGGQQPVARNHKNQQHGADDADYDEECQERLLAPFDVGDSAQSGREHGGQQQRYADAHAPVGRGMGRAGQRRPGDLAVVDRQHG